MSLSKNNLPQNVVDRVQAVYDDMLAFIEAGEMPGHLTLHSWRSKLYPVLFRRDWYRLDEGDIPEFIVTIGRADPEGCGCTDCIVGDYSRNVDLLNKYEIVALLRGDLMNATGCNLQEIKEKYHDPR